MSRMILFVAVAVLVGGISLAPMAFAVGGNTDEPTSGTGIGSLYDTIDNGATGNDQLNERDKDLDENAIQSRVPDSENLPSMVDSHRHSGGTH